MNARCGWEANDERAAFADLAALERQRAAVAVGELAADKEAEAGAGLRPESGIVDPEEALEDLVVLVPRDADPVVLDDERRTAFVDDGQADPWATRAVGQRVVDEVVDDSSQLLTVGVDRNGLVWLAVGYLRPKQAGARLGAGEGLSSHLAQIEGLGVGWDGAALDAGGGQQIIDDAVQLGGLADQDAQRSLPLGGCEGAILE